MWLSSVTVNFVIRQWQGPSFCSMFHLIMTLYRDLESAEAASLFLKDACRPCPMCTNMIPSSTNLNSHVRAHTSRVHRSQVMIKRPQPAPCVVSGSQWSTCHPAVRSRTNIIEPCEMKMHPCVLCAAKFRSRKELDNHNGSEIFGERPFPCRLCGNKLILLETKCVLPR